MTLILPLAVLLSAAVALLVLAGRESLRMHGFAPRPVDDVTDLAHLASLGFSHLNEASARAATKRMTRPF